MIFETKIIDETDKGFFGKLKSMFVLDEKTVLRNLAKNLVAGSNEIQKGTLAEIRKLKMSDQVILLPEVINLFSSNDEDLRINTLIFLVDLGKSSKEGDLGAIVFESLKEAALFHKQHIVQKFSERVLRLAFPKEMGTIPKFNNRGFLGTDISVGQ